MRIQFLPLCFTLLSAIACASFLGCAKGQSNVEKGNAERELYIGIGTEPEGLDPHIVTGVTEHYVLLSLFEGLTTVHPETLEIEPGVAQSWELYRRRSTE